MIPAALYRQSDAPILGKALPECGRGAIRRLGLRLFRGISFELVATLGQTLFGVKFARGNP